MSFYSDASLALIPSGYKNGKVYSALPTDGSGDLSFTRASNATRVASNGLIEKVRTNIALYSEQFNDASWNKGTLTVSANAATAPNGTTTADLIYPSANSSNCVIFNGVTISSGVEYTNSVYVKASGKTWTFIRGINDGAGAFFDLSNGVVGTVQSGVTATITSIGSGWYRCSVTQTSTFTTGRLVILVVDGNASSAVTANGTDGLLIWGGQQEADVMTDYIPTTTTAVSVGPVSGLPRLDYLNSSCPRLLLEPQRSNLALQSESFDNAPWGQNGITATANTATSPDGFTNADTLEKVGGSGGLGFYYIVTTVTSNTTNTFSVFAKYKTGSGIIWLLGKNSGSFAYFNLQTGAALSATAGMTTKIENYGNGWYRCSFTQDYTGASDYTFGVGVCLAAGAPNYDATAAATQGVYAWGAQFEAGAYATSYIPTLGASVTRVADAASKTGITSLIGQTEGTIFFDGVISGVQNSSTNIINSEKNTTCSFYMQRVTSSSQISAGFIFSGTTTAVVSGGTVAIGQRVKIAWAYKSGSNALYINGTLINSNTTTFTPPSTFDDLFLNDDTTYFGYQEGVQFNQTLLFKTRLTNAQLAELTTI
jgi:hypothetical protein